MGKNVTQKLIASHLVSGKMEPGEEIELRIDQTLTQDATGTMVMLELEAMGLDRVKTEVSVQYVDHNLLQTDYRNPDDHLFLRSACLRFGIWYSKPGNGVSHPVHQERFGIPGKTLLGSDSHTPAAGAIGMLSMGAGGLAVALAMAGRPYGIRMPLVHGVRLTGKLPPWVSAKDVILEMLRRHGVSGGRGRVIEYFGPGLDELSAMDRHVIANMGTELGATTTVFPSDQEVRRFLKSQGRESDWVEIVADADANYDELEEIDLSTLEPLIALPSSPGSVVPVSEVAGREIYQSYIGSSANPGFRDFAVPALIVEGRQVHDAVSFDINPTSRQILENLMHAGYLQMLTRAGARIHQAGCNGCIGMGQAPATGRNSLRTVPRNFEGRSGTKEDSVYLCSPETAAASALTGVITDPRTLEDQFGITYRNVREPDRISINVEQLLPPNGSRPDLDLEKGPNILSLPDFDPLPDAMGIPVILKVGDDVSTDHIMPAGSRVLPFRSNIPQIAKFVFYQVDESFPERALDHKEKGFAVVGGGNYGQGSSREHAAIAPRYLGLRVVVAKSFARIHRQNLAYFGILPLAFVDPSDLDGIEQGMELQFRNLRSAIASGTELEATLQPSGRQIRLKHDLGRAEIEMILNGSLINVIKQELEEA